MTERPQDLSEAELAAWQYEHRDELDAAADHAETIELEDTARPVTTSFRIPAIELTAIRKAADAAGMSQSEWIRRACTQTLAAEPTIPSREAVAEIAHLRERLGTLVDTELAEFARRHGVPMGRAS